MKKLLRATAITWLLPAAFAADPPPAADIAVSEDATPPFHFNLVPKPFQRNPQLEMTVYTELTPFGRSLTPATPEAPVPFIASAQGFRPMGDNVGHQRPPLPTELETILFRALTGQGYVAAADGQVPALVLIYFWGSHYRLDLEMARIFPEMQRQHLLERAVLVGGREYADEIERQFVFGFMPQDRFLKKAYLYQQADTDLYYVVVSAYDHDSVLHSQPRLAWRTTMTVNALGVSMKESLPPLLLTAGPWFGRETEEAVALRRHVRRGTVELGPLIIIDDDPPPAGTPAK